MTQNEPTKINVKDLKRVLDHVITNNKYIQEKGIMPVAINVIGDSGLGKTSVIKQVAYSHGFKPENVVKRNLAAFEEIGDLIGIPLTEFKMTKKGEDGKFTYQWVKEPAIPTFEKLGFHVMNESRMGYSVPDWIAGKKGGGVLILDDYNRASQRFTQAVMELILEQEYASWKLPEGWTIILSSNPDNGSYNVTSQDSAQRTRQLSVNVKWDAEIWAEWAERHGVDSRCINFTLMNPEIVSDKTPDINARSITMFYNAIMSIPNFAEDSSLELIKLLGEGSMGDVFSTQFTAFIKHNMDKLITIKRMLDPAVPFSKIDEEMKASIGKGEKYRGDIAYVLATRLINYAAVNFDGPVDQPILDRMKDILSAKTLGSDLKFVIGKKITDLESQAFFDLLMDQDIIDTII